ncbi:MAG: outer membrane beta-barrel protein [Flavobacteriales bacterium AspAUS03]
MQHPFYNNLNPFRWNIYPKYYFVSNPDLRAAFIQNLELNYFYNRWLAHKPILQTNH